jgi:pilus assembly protein CpaC
MANRVRPSRAGSLILLLALAGSTTVVWAQGLSNPDSATQPATQSTAPAAAPTSAAAAPAVVAADPGAVRLMVGRSAILNVGSAITRVSLTSAEVADAMVTAPGQILVNGKLPGTISMFVWDKAGALSRYEVTVQRDLTRLSEQMTELFPGESISVQSNGRNVVLSGKVTHKDVIEKAVNVAAGYVDKKEEVVTLLQVQGNAPTNQVLLRVRFAEVSRSAITELGASMFTSGRGIENNVGRVTTQQFAAPNFDELSSTKSGQNWQEFGHPVDSADGKLSFSDFLNFFLFNEKYDLGVAIRALQNRGLFQSLAEPNLVAESGKEASFLAGGEFPIPVAQGSGANLAINVVFKEFGIRLNFTPTVNGDRINLKVRPEVSSLDFNNAVVLQGFRIPALSTRRTETELELRNGQTFAIAGLLNNTVTSTLSKVPGIGDIPILGYLFKSKAAQKNQTELVVMITPEILANGSRGVTPDLPRGTEPFIAPIPERELMPAPPEAFEAERRGTSTDAAPPVAPQVAAAQGPTADPIAALSALTPSTTRKMAEPGVKAATTSPAPVADKPLTGEEKKALERAKKDEEARARERDRLEAKATADQQKRQAAAEQKAADVQKERDAKAAREQVRREAEEKKKAEEEARRELARQRERQKAVDEAAAELKAAQQRYDAVASNGR